MDFKAFLDTQQEAYVNGDTENLLDDGEFDAIVEAYELQTGQKTNYIGATPRSDGEPLDEPMPSLNKVKGDTAEKDIARFLFDNRGPYIISDKVDGSSLQLRYDNGNLYIRTGGDGLIGKNASYILNYMSFPKVEGSYVIRGELTILNDVFEREVSPILKSQGLKGDNSRPFVNGLVNKVDSDKSLLSKCVFIAFGVLSEDWKKDQQFAFLQQYGFNLPNPTILEYTMSPQEMLKYLEQDLLSRRERVPYRIDGSVITDIPNSRKITENSNPDFEIAFKIDTYAVGIIKSVTWNGVSRFGKLTPVATVEPLNIIGSTINNATAHNAKFVMEHGIGPGAIVTMTLGGDVIPKIVSAIKKSVPLEPSVQFHWDENKTYIYLVNPEYYPCVHVGRMLYFLKHMGIKRTAIKSLIKFYNAGITNVSQLINASKDKLMSIERMGEKSADYLIEETRKAIEKASWGKIMASTGFFGQGIADNTMNDFVTHFPMWEFQDVPEDQIKRIHGFGESKAGKIAVGLPFFRQWLAENPMVRPKKKELIDRSLSGQVIVFTGFRNDSIKSFLESKGATVKDSWVNAVTIILAKDTNSSSKKMKEARAAGKNIPIVPMQDYENIERYIR